MTTKQLYIILSILFLNIIFMYFFQGYSFTLFILLIIFLFTKWSYEENNNKK